MKSLSAKFINPLEDGFPTQNGNHGYWAPKGHFSPNCITVVDRSVFHHTPAQKGALITAKTGHREELQRVYGSNWKKHLNTPDKTLQGSIKHSF